MAAAQQLNPSLEGEKKNTFVLQYWWQKQALPLPFKEGGEKKADEVWFVHDYDTFALRFLGERFWFDS